MLKKSYFHFKTQHFCNHGLTGFLYNQTPVLAFFGSFKFFKIITRINHKNFPTMPPKCLWISKLKNFGSYLNHRNILHHKKIDYIEDLTNVGFVCIFLHNNSCSSVESDYTLDSAMGFLNTEI